MKFVVSPRHVRRACLTLALIVALPVGTSNGALADGTPASAPPAPPASGATLPIESVMLEYQASMQGAKRIANAIDAALHPVSASGSVRPRVFLVTNADIAGLQRVRLTLEQAALLRAQIDNVREQIGQPPFRCIETATPKPRPTRRPVSVGSGIGALTATSGGASFLGGLLSSGPSLSALLQVVQTAASVNESAAPPVAGALSDPMLVNLVAGSLVNDDVYVPAVYPPGLATAAFEDTSLFRSVLALEDARSALLSATSAELERPACRSKANAAIVAAVRAQTATVAGLVNAFETSLFSGSATVLALSASPKIPGGAPAAPSPPSASALTATVASFADLLASDLLLDAMAGSSSAPTLLVSLHVLESGGTTLAKSNVLGSRMLYSGGSVATFNMYTDRGVFMCGGVSYAYRGFVAGRDVGSPGGSPDVQTANLACSRSLTAATP